MVVLLYGESPDAWKHALIIAVKANADINTKYVSKEAYLRQYSHKAIKYKATFIISHNIILFIISDEYYDIPHITNNLHPSYKRITSNTYKKELSTNFRKRVIPCYIAPKHTLSSCHKFQYYCYLPSK